jgi:hypothetical protein
MQSNKAGSAITAELCKIIHFYVWTTKQNSFSYLLLKPLSRVLFRFAAFAAGQRKYREFISMQCPAAAVFVVGRDYAHGTWGLKSHK